VTAWRSGSVDSAISIAGVDRWLRDVRKRFW
jgi:hypothetical protein